MYRNNNINNNNNNNNNKIKENNYSKLNNLIALLKNFNDHINTNNNKKLLITSDFKKTIEETIKEGEEGENKQKKKDVMHHVYFYYNDDKLKSKKKYKTKENPKKKRKIKKVEDLITIEFISEKPFNEDQVNEFPPYKVFVRWLIQFLLKENSIKFEGVNNPNKVDIIPENLMPLKILLFIDCRLNTTLTRIEAKEKCTNIETLLALKNNIKINLINYYTTNDKNIYVQLQDCIMILRNCDIIRSNYKRYFNKVIEYNNFTSLNEFVNLKLENLMCFILFDIDKLFRDAVKLNIIKDNKERKITNFNNINSSDSEDENSDNNGYDIVKCPKEKNNDDDDKVYVDITKEKEYDKSKQKLDKIFVNLSDHFINKYNQYGYNEKAKKTKICDLLLRMDFHNLFNIIIYWCYN